jgi:hypothetical protein
MKAYKLEVLVIDFENIGDAEIVNLLEDLDYIYPSVKDVKCVDIGDWHDDHPLNKKNTYDEEYKRIFKTA